jgi:hypothetical protein
MRLDKTPPFRVLFLACLALVLAACGSKSQAFELPAGVASVCEISADEAGQVVEVGGEIVFVDDTNPSAYYADLEYGDCRVGIVAEPSTWSGWTEEERSRFSVGAKVVASGLLAQSPMPARPDEYQLVVELHRPLHPAGEIPALAGREVQPSLPPITEPACEYMEVDFSMDLEMFGKIIVYDDEAAAGIYAELDNGYCVTRLWVERTRWEDWSQEERALFNLGSDVAVEGILTPVLDEPVLDLSLPPRPNK